MNSEYVVEKERIRWINDKYGGSLRTDAEIETSLELGKGKSVYMKIAYLWRAILVGHPFSDGNKRTALIVTIAILENCKMKINDLIKERITSSITKISKENVTDICRIERLVRYAIEGN